jgi:NMD protein affecting ribosome stability and mRNA decay
MKGKNIRLGINLFCQECGKNLRKGQSYLCSECLREKERLRVKKYNMR